MLPLKTVYIGLVGEHVTKECECGNKITSINVRKSQEAIDIEEMAFCLEFECQVCGKTYKLNIEEIDEDDID